MTEERSEECFASVAPCCGGVAMHSHPRFDAWPNEPGPDRALMIRAVALQHTAFVMRHVIRFTGRERTQADRCEQLFFDGGHDTFRRLAFEELKWQSANGEDLIRAERGVHFTRAMVCVNHVVEAASFLVPEFVTEGFQTTVERFLPLWCEQAGDFERVEP